MLNEHCDFQFFVACYYSELRLFFFLTTGPYKFLGLSGIDEDSRKISLIQVHILPFLSYYFWAITVVSSGPCCGKAIVSDLMLFCLCIVNLAILDRAHKYTDAQTPNSVLGSHWSLQTSVRACTVLSSLSLKRLCKAKKLYRSSLLPRMPLKEEINLHVH